MLKEVDSGVNSLHGGLFFYEFIIKLKIPRFANRITIIKEVSVSCLKKLFMTNLMEFEIKNYNCKQNSIGAKEIWLLTC